MLRRLRCRRTRNDHRIGLFIRRTGKKKATIWGSRSICSKLHAERVSGPSHGSDFSATRHSRVSAGLGNSKSSMRFATYDVNGHCQVEAF